MNEPRIHHYIPRFYLNGFVDPIILDREKKEVLWVYERGKLFRPSSPSNEARQRDFYTFVEEGSRNTAFETWFGDLEAQVSPIIARLTRDRRHVTDPEKETLALFVGTMQMRTPAGRWLSENRITPLVSRIMKEAAGDPLSFRSFIADNSSHSDYEESELEQIRQDILTGRADAVSARKDLELLSIIEVGRKVADVLLEMNWQTIFTDNQESFLTSDDPVVSWVINEKTNELFLRMGVDSPGVNVWFPLSRSICIRMNKECESGPGRWVDAGIRYVNKMTIMSADRYVYASERSDKIKTLFDKKGGQVSVKSADLRFEGRKL
jgi:hypothetical protein